MLKLRETYKKIFVCSASWHPQKRLHENVKLYRTIRDNFDDYKDSCLIVLGPNPTMDKFCIRDNIFYTGHQSQEICKQVFAAADFMIHLSYIDHCPNVVLESLSQETPVICTNSGGTSELLIGNENNKNGLVLDDVVFNFELSDYDNPPSIPDYDMKKLETFLSSKIVIENSHLDIKLCANSYAKMLETIIKNDK